MICGRCMVACVVSIGSLEKENSETKQIAKHQNDDL